MCNVTGHDNVVAFHVNVGGVVATTAQVSIYIFRAMLKAGALAGVDPDVARNAIHLDRVILNDPDARIPMEREVALWQVLAECSGDAYFGLHAGLTLEAGEFDVMDYAIRTSGTLRHAFENVRRYNRLLHDVAEFELTDNGTTARFEHYFRDDPKGASWHAADFTLSSVYAIGLGISGQHWEPKRVCFQHDEPADISPYKKVFPCALEFNCDRNCLEFDSAVLNYRVVGGDSALNAVLIRHAHELLSKLPASDNVVDQVRAELAICLRQGEPTIEQVAGKLHITPRMLQRRLNDSGDTYKALVDAMRKGLADRYLRESQFGVSEIAYLLGYSEPSAFHRAFKRWFKKSPAKFRQANAVA